MIDPRDPRVAFAAERTLLAWIRTGLAMMGFGFVVASLQAPRSLWMGTALVILGALVNITAAVQYSGIARKLRNGQPITSEAPMWSAVVVAIVLAVIGAVTAISLLVMR
jgi:putative membrane protein